MSKARTLAAAALAAAGLFFSAPAAAQFYLGFSFGQAEVDQSLIVPDLLDPGGTVDGKDGAFKLFGGYQFNRNFALEVAAVDLGDMSYSGFFSGTPSGPVSGGRVQNGGLNLSAVGVLPLGERLALFGKAGIFLWSSEATDITGGVPTISEADGSDLSLGLGASFALTPRASLRAEWERFEMSSSDVDLVSVGLAFSF
jgi:OmpA-OmpF porin, OOP family